MSKRRIRPSRLSNDVTYNQSFFSNISIQVPGRGNVHKDNDKFCRKRTGGCSASINPIRVPSLKRSDRIWKNFYKLFPKYLYIMQTLLHKKNNHKNYIIFYPHTPYKTTIKLKIVDMSSESLTIVEQLYGRENKKIICANDLWKMNGIFLNL